MHFDNTLWPAFSTFKQFTTVCCFVLFFPTCFLRNRNVGRQHPLQWMMKKWEFDLHQGILFVLYGIYLLGALCHTLLSTDKQNNWNLELVWKLRQAEACQGILKRFIWSEHLHAPGSALHIPAFQESDGNAMCTACCKKGRWWPNWCLNIQNFMTHAVLGVIASFLPRDYLFLTSTTLSYATDMRFKKIFFPKVQFFYK